MNRSKINGVFWGGVMLIFGMFAFGAVCFERVYGQDDDFPPSREEHEFKKYRIHHLTYDEVSQMALDEPRLKVAYYYYFTSIPHHGVSVPRWKKNVYSDMLARAGDIQSLFESMYRNADNQFFQKRMLYQMQFFPSIDKIRFIPMIRQEIDFLPEKMSVGEVNNSQMCVKMEFMLRWGGQAELEYVRDKVKQYEISDPLTMKALEDAEVKGEANQRTVTGGGRQGQDPNKMKVVQGEPDKGLVKSWKLISLLFGGVVLLCWLVWLYTRTKRF